jgi:pleiotropic regulator 1
MVKCWDLEVNKVIRQYHGHLSGVYACSLHPTLDVLVTGGRDATARVRTSTRPLPCPLTRTDARLLLLVHTPYVRTSLRLSLSLSVYGAQVWDIRTKNNIHVLGGHTNTVASIVTQAATPQVITGSMDSTVRLWDLAAGKTLSVLTNHKKSIRSIVLHPTEYAERAAAAYTRRMHLGSHKHSHTLSLAGAYAATCLSRARRTTSSSGSAPMATLYKTWPATMP